MMIEAEYTNQFNSFKILIKALGSSLSHQRLCFDLHLFISRNLRMYCLKCSEKQVPRRVHQGVHDGGGENAACLAPCAAVENPRDGC